MAKKSKRLSENRWSLWVDSRYRVTIPKDLMVEMGWQGGDTLLWSVMDDRSVHVRSLDRDLRVRVTELEGLRGTMRGTPEATRVGALAMEIGELADRLYPLDASSPQAASAQQAFAETQTRARLRKNKVVDPVDAILMCLEARRVTYKGIQDLKRRTKRRPQR